MCNNNSTCLLLKILQSNEFISSCIPILNFFSPFLSLQDCDSYFSCFSNDASINNYKIHEILQPNNAPTSFPREVRTIFSLSTNPRLNYYSYAWLKLLKHSRPSPIFYKVQCSNKNIQRSSRLIDAIVKKGGSRLRAMKTFRNVKLFVDFDFSEKT